jgi:hypothetical protein
MPKWNKIHAFVKFVHDENKKAVDDEEALGNLIDPNFYDQKAIKLDNAIRKFAKKQGYDQVEAVSIYKSAENLRYVRRKDAADGTHVVGIILQTTVEGDHFVETSGKLNTGKWNGMAQYYMRWSTALSVIAIIVSIASVVVAIFALNKPQ